MSLTKINYSIADKVIDIYTELLGNLQHFEKYGYSAMRGHDIIDIINSLSLITAYRVHTAYHVDAKKLEEFKKYASEDQSAIFQYIRNIRNQLAEKYLHYKNDRSSTHK